MKAQQSARALGLSRRTEAARKGAEGFLRGYRRETGGLPTRSTWRNAWQGKMDTGGRQITVRLKCHLCRMERVVGLADADNTPSFFQARGFSCGVLRDVCCEESAPGQRGEPLALKRTTVLRGVITPSSSQRPQSRSTADKPDWGGGFPKSLSVANPTVWIPLSPIASPTPFQPRHTLWEAIATEHVPRALLDYVSLPATTGPGRSKAHWDLPLRWLLPRPGGGLRAQGH